MQNFEWKSWCFYANLLLDHRIPPFRPPYNLILSLALAGAEVRLWSMFDIKEIWLYISIAKVFYIRIRTFICNVCNRNFTQFSLFKIVTSLPFLWILSSLFNFSYFVICYGFNLFFSSRFIVDLFQSWYEKGKSH